MRVKVWDPMIRVFHWTLVVAFTANALVVAEDGKLHEWIGYLVLGLVLFRLLWGLTGPRYARFASFPPSLSGALGQLGEIVMGRNHRHLGHTPLGAWMIYNLLVTLIIVSLSGYLMTTNMFWGTEWTEELHEASVLWAEISVVLHVAAVLFESRRTGVNLPRAMVNGYKEFPPNP